MGVPSSCRGHDQRSRTSRFQRQCSWRRRRGKQRGEKRAAGVLTADLVGGDGRVCSTAGVLPVELMIFKWIRSASSISS